MAYALHKTFVNKVACSGILSPFLLTCHTRNGLSAEAKSFPTRNSSSKALPNGKCGARNTCIYFIVVFFYSTGQSSSSDVLFYWIGLRSLSVDPRAGGATPIWNRRGCSSEILDLTPKGDQLGVAQAFCDPYRRPIGAWLKQILTPKRDR